MEIRKKIFFSTIFWHEIPIIHCQHFFGGPSAFPYATASRLPLGLPTMAGGIALGTDHDEAMCRIRLLHLLFIIPRGPFKTIMGSGVWSDFTILNYILIYNWNHNVAENMIEPSTES